MNALHAGMIKYDRAASFREEWRRFSLGSIHGKILFPLRDSHAAVGSICFAYSLIPEMRSFLCFLHIP